MDKFKLIKRDVCAGALFLQGVFKKDCKCIEDMFQEKIFQEKTPGHVYDKIPAIFNSIANWPKTTNLLCWFCNRSFKSVPWFEPQSIEPAIEQSDGKILSGADLHKSKPVKTLSIIPHGNFCSCNCVRAHIDLHTVDMSEKINKISMLGYLYELFTGKSIDEIQPAPHPSIMIQYGGSISPQEYQEKLNNLDNLDYKEEDRASIFDTYSRVLEDQP